MSAPDLRRVEEASLNGSATPRQILYDGWLLRLAPGKAKRARSVNAHYPSTRPLSEKIDYCERIYAVHGLPRLFRITPFVHPSELDAELERRSYARFDLTLAQGVTLPRPPDLPDLEVELRKADVRSFVEAVAAMRRSSRQALEAHLERLLEAPLPSGRVFAWLDGRPVACGQWMLHDGLAGVYDVITAEDARGRGLATLVTAHLLAQAWERGASFAHLQVDESNAPALAVYRKFGFATLYTYHYRAPHGECE